MLGIRKQEPCAWHSSSEEIALVDSPGICGDCADAMELQSKQRQFDKVPSYAGNREKYVEYMEKKRRR